MARRPSMLPPGGALSAVVSTALRAARPAAQGAPGWPDDAASRLAALALIEALNADLLSHDSATLTLERWCDTHRIASPAHVTATRVREAETPADAAVRRLLGVDDAEAVHHRHVRLACGGHTLSEADNHYLPGRLTPEMNRLLDTSDTAFGRAVADLGFERRTLSVDVLWRPLDPGWETAAPPPAAAPGRLLIPAEILRHRALLVLPDGTPFSALVETYTGEILAFPPPRP